MFADFGSRWADTRQREDLLHVAAALEREPSLIGLSAHRLAVATSQLAGEHDSLTDWTTNMSAT